MDQINDPIAIYGGNLSAAIAAIALKKTGLNVLWMGDLPSGNWPESAVVSLNRNSQKWLKSWGIFPSKHHHYDTIAVQSGQTPLRFHSQDILANTLGCIVHLGDLSAAILDQMQSMDARSDITLDNWQEHARLLITSKPLAPIKRSEPLSHQVATAVIQKSSPANTAWQWFDNCEIIAHLPTSTPDQFALIHSSPQAYTEEKLLARLQQLCPEVTALSNLSPYVPTRIKHYTPYVHNNCIAIHQACYDIHPMSGFSLNMGISDIHCLTQHIHRNLLDYERERWATNSQTLTMIQGLYHLYCDPGFNHPIIDWGINGLNRCDLLKQFLISQAESV